MRSKLIKACKNVSSLGELKEKVIEVITILRKENNYCRIAYVAGIITSEGEEKIAINKKILKKHVENVRKKYRIKVFSTVDIFNREMIIKIGGYKGEETEKEIRKFWVGVLSTGHVTDIFMTPRWELSTGANMEHKIAKKLGVTIHYI